MATETKLLNNAINHIDQAISNIETLLYGLNSIGVQGGPASSTLNKARIALENIGNRLDSKKIKQALL